VISSTVADATLGIVIVLRIGVETSEDPRLAEGDELLGENLDARDLDATGGQAGQGLAACERVAEESQEEEGPYDPPRVVEPGRQDPSRAS
jgi:hypothetical protein